MIIRDPQHAYATEQNKKPKNPHYTIIYYRSTCKVEYCSNRVINDSGLQYELNEVADGQYGSDVGNGEWNGMVGEVLRGVSFTNRSYLT